MGMILYGCGADAKKFLIENPDVIIDYCIDDRTGVRNFYNYIVHKSSYLKNHKPKDRIIIFSKNVNSYMAIKSKLESFNYKEFEDFIPSNLYKKKMALVWGNCHVNYIKAFLSASPEFSQEYSFYNTKRIWELKPTDMDDEVFKHCDLVIMQEIRQNNSVGEHVSSQAIKDKISKNCTTLKFSNLSRLSKFMYPQTYSDNATQIGIYKDFLVGDTQWYRDKYIDECIKKGIKDPQKIISYINKHKLVDQKKLEDDYNQFCEKLNDREKNVDIKIADFIFDKIKTEKLFIDFEHPSKYLLNEVGNRILDYLGYSRLPEDYYISMKYGHEVPVYQDVKNYFGCTWNDGNLKQDNEAEKISQVYMDIKEYIRQYLIVYSNIFNDNNNK